MEKFWKDVFKAINEVFGSKISMDPTVALLGLVPDGIKGRTKKYLLQIFLTTAIKCITIRWLKPDPPTYNMWTEKIKEISDGTGNILFKTSKEHVY